MLDPGWRGEQLYTFRRTAGAISVKAGEGPRTVASYYLALMRASGELKAPGHAGRARSVLPLLPMGSTGARRNLGSLAISIMPCAQVHS